MVEEQIADEAGVEEHATEDNVAVEQVAGAEENVADETGVEEDINKGESPVEVSK